MFDECKKYIIDVNSSYYIRSKEKLREYLFRDKFNPIAYCDTIISRTFFGPETPFRFLPGGDVLEGYKKHIETLKVAMDTYYFLMDRQDPDIVQALNLARTFTIVNIYDRKEEWKSLCKQYRNSDFSFEKQFILSFFRCLYVVQDSNVTIPFLKDYINEFQRDSINYDHNDLTTSEKLFLAELARKCDQHFQKDYIPVPKPAANTMSSMGHKKMNDQKDLLEQLDDFDEINDEAQKVLILALEAIEIAYNEDLTKIKEKVKGKKSNPNSLVLLDILPKLSIVSQNKGKVSRTVFAGNDILDLALDSAMEVTKELINPLSCCDTSAKYRQSTYSFAKKKCDIFRTGVRFSKRIKSDYSIVIKSDMQGADASNATEKISGRNMTQCFLELYDNLSEETKQRIGLPRRYFEICAQILCETPYYYLLEGNYYTSFSYGTAQGLKWSWDLLNLQTLTKVGGSAVEYFVQQRSSRPVLDAIRMTLMSAVKGDDGLFPSVIGNLFKKNLQAVSLPGVVNDSKTESEDEVGYAPFASAYVTTSTKRVLFLSNLRFISTIRKFSDPYEYVDQVYDYFDSQQVRQCKNIIDLFDTVYNFSNREMIHNHPELLQDYQTFTRVSGYIRFLACREQIQDSIAGKPLKYKNHSNVGMTDKLAPYRRALTVRIDNMHISSQRAYTLLSNKALESVLEIDRTYVDDIDRDLAETKDLHFNQGYDWSDIKLSEDKYDKIFHQMMMREGSPIKVIGFSFTEYNLLYYDKVYTGYINRDLIMRCTFKATTRR